MAGAGRTLDLKAKLLLAVLAAVVSAASAAGGETVSGFSAGTDSAGNQFGAAADWVAPVADPSVVAKTFGFLAGSVKPGGNYRVYAHVDDSVNPPSGVSTTTADVSTLTSGQTAATLSGGSYDVGGVSYNRQSSQLTAGSLLSEGSFAYAITSKDTAGNTGTRSGLAVTVDATSPTATDVQTANGGGGNVVGKAERGDQLIITTSERIDPFSILSGWTGESTKVVVRLIQGTLGIVNDTVRIYDETNTTQLPLGTIDLGRLDYVTTSSVTFGEAANPSRMVQSGNVITITFGGLAGGTPNTAAGSGTMVWTPSTNIYDGAGNTSTSVARTEGGPADKEF